MVSIGRRDEGLKVESQKVDDFPPFRLFDILTFRLVTVTPRREFLHIDDLADACFFLMNSYDSPEIINIGVGQDISIKELAQLMQEISGFRGEVRFDVAKPDGTPRKLLDVSRFRGLGWRHSLALREGAESAYEIYRG